MSTIYTQTILDTECIGDSLDIINSNFDNLGTAVVNVSSSVANGSITPAKLSTGGPSWNTSGNLTVSGNSTISGTLSAAGGIIGSSLVARTAQSATGTAIDFTGIPSWVKRITIMLSGVSTTGTSSLRMQAGSGSIQATGYAATPIGVAGVAVSVAGAGTNQAGWDFNDAGSAASVRYGAAYLTLLSSNTWVITSMIADPVRYMSTAGSVTLTGTLDRVRITTVNGTDNFDAGTVNIMYEG